jgi:thioredoxin-dependent peroxiredoxin
MEKSTDKVTMKGNPVTLVGSSLNVGDAAPDAILTANDLSDCTIQSLKGKTLILSVVPSLDTAVCALQTKRFESEAVNLGSDVMIVTISMDLPFAQKRWCSECGVSKVMTLSDHRRGTFGEAYGVLIKEFRLLARSIFVIDPDGIIRYKEIVNEITSEPDYASALKAISHVSLSNVKTP